MKPVKAGRKDFGATGILNIYSSLNALLVDCT